MHSSVMISAMIETLYSARRPRSEATFAVSLAALYFTPKNLLVYYALWAIVPVGLLSSLRLQPAGSTTLPW